MIFLGVLSAHSEHRKRGERKGDAAVRILSWRGCRQRRQTETELRRVWVDSCHHRCFWIHCIDYFMWETSAAREENCAQNPCVAPQHTKIPEGPVRVQTETKHKHTENDWSTLFDCEATVPITKILHTNYTLLFTPDINTLIRVS